MAGKSQFNPQLFQSAPILSGAYLMRLPALLCFSLACSLAVLPAVGHAEKNTKGGPFRAGAYAIDVTPLELPVIVNGGMRERMVDKVVDRLHARCLVLDDGQTKLVIAVVDSCMIPRTLLDQAKEMASKSTGIPVENMLISATHTHQAPSVFGCLGSDADAKYSAFLPPQIAKGIVMAHKNLAPARIGWGVAHDKKNVYIRRFLMKPGKASTTRFTGKTNDRAQMNPGFNNPNAIRRLGVPDTAVSVLSVQTPQGLPIALLANYSTHYAGGPALSADYFGVFASLVAKKLGGGDRGDAPPFMAAMTNGTSGDTNCLDFTRPANRKYDRFTVGADVAAAALEAYEKIEYKDQAPLAMREAKLPLNIRAPDAAEVAEATEYLKQFNGRKPQVLDEIYARETVLLGKMPVSRKIKLQAIRIGSLGIAAIPNEVYSSTGLSIKKHSPFKTTFTIELANGCEGYLAPPEQHKLGGYTTWRARSSCLETGAEPKVRKKIMSLLGEVAGNSTD